MDAGAGTSLLRATDSVGGSFSASTDSAVAQGARASKLRVLVPGRSEEKSHKTAAEISKLGSALLTQLPAGSATTISTVEGGVGTVRWLKWTMACCAQEIDVVKEDASASSIGGTDAQAWSPMPLASCWVGVGLRARAAAAELQLRGLAEHELCGQCLGSGIIASMYYVYSVYIYTHGERCGEATPSTIWTAAPGRSHVRWLRRGLGSNRWVANQASVSSLEIKRCDDLVVKSNLDPPISLQLNLPLGLKGASNDLDH